MNDANPLFDKCTNPATKSFPKATLNGLILEIASIVRTLHGGGSRVDSSLPTPPQQVSLIVALHMEIIREVQ